ncbi:hypothetical protein SYNPS1DRAFT_21819 [Syncephalis pseudoplumigaleata]|uniref:Uncharacterized protein n=1 Tax=Syncephalis pseudoplumigaleata TaxID=1712513 RepID=A0A4P9Z1Q0_9FUNG|nr:hypothetical protein SYNPS1DRAFT_21819 [Syncephalis pseudoplumigaleata]|eukprot:RKP26417.1 hypothetical protein SYNPS1DRAFT_21819 [Syncephalis pseudoplumigaleata]
MARRLSLPPRGGRDRPLTEELQQLADQAPDNIVALDDKTFPKFLEQGHEYAALVPEYQLTASSWRKMGAPLPLYFIHYDINAAPAALFFHPTLGPNATKADPLAEDIVDFIENATGVEVTLYRPIDWKKHGMNAAIVIGFLVALRFSSHYVWAVLSNTRVWSAISLVFLLIMMSGLMWNQIRMPPYHGGSAQQPEYIAPGFQQQYVAETQIVALLYAGCAFATVSLVTRVPAIKDSMLQNVVALVWTMLLVIIYSLLLRLFRVKNGSYPFKLLF